MADIAEDRLVQWLCGNLPALNEAAEQDGWLSKLNAALRALRDGKPASQALADNGIPIGPDTPLERADPTRGGPVSLDGLGIAAVSVVGDYTCPAEQPCGRRAHHDELGREPRCWISQRTMIRSTNASQPSDRRTDRL